MVGEYRWMGIRGLVGMDSREGRGGQGGVLVSFKWGLWDLFKTKKGLSWLFA